MPSTTWVRAFFDEAGHGVWHTENAWSSLPEGWSQRAWRGGWLSGSEASMSRWEERPGEMAARWREGEAGTALRRTDFGWQLQGEGVLFWPDLNMGCGKDNSSVRPTLFAPRGAGFRVIGGRAALERPPPTSPLGPDLVRGRHSECPLGERDGKAGADGTSSPSGVKTFKPWQQPAGGPSAGRDTTSL